jgi:hypothetical protein
MFVANTPRRYQKYEHENLRSPSAFFKIIERFGNLISKFSFDINFRQFLEL